MLLMNLWLRRKKLGPSFYPLVNTIQSVAKAAPPSPRALASVVTTETVHTMKLKDKTIVVTGGGHGIGKALCKRFATEQPRGIVVADIDYEAAQEVAQSIGGLAVGGLAIACDVANEESVVSLIDETESNVGPIDLFCLNAGIAGASGPDVSNDVWDQFIDINFMSHVYTARALVPRMLERGSGYLLHTSSAAGLLTEISSAPYSVTKHAVVAFAEWLSIAHGPRGLKVSCLCPQGVRTRMIAVDHPMTEMLRERAISTEELAECVVAGLDKENFLILPHADVARFVEHKATDHDGWISAMQKLRIKILGEEG